jgi:HlyD family secretion protein
MQHQLYPAALAEDSLERHVARHTRKGHAVYLTVVSLFLAVCAALPLLRVSVSVQGAGIIRPTTDKHEVRSRVSGLAAQIRVHEGQIVSMGDTVAVLRTVAVEGRETLLAEQEREKQRTLADLELLAGTNLSAADTPRLQTSTYRQEYVQFDNERRENTIRQDKARKDLERTRLLHAQHFTTSTELEDRQFQFDQAKADGALILERYRAKWQASAAGLREEIKALASQRQQVGEERSLYTVTAPVSGTVEQLSSVSAGSFVQAGEALAVISPTSTLVAEIYVTPRDIGLVRAGASVRMLIDAFNYSDWGFVNGQVAEVSGDFVQMNGQPMFKVRCFMDRERLTLRNGFSGQLKKGMTLRGRFVVAERSVLQLLSDDINDWLNPARGPLAGSAIVVARD